MPSDFWIAIVGVVVVFAMFNCLVSATKQRSGSGDNATGDGSDGHGYSGGGDCGHGGDCGDGGH
jgi:hypothetical protein